MHVTVDKQTFYSDRITPRTISTQTISPGQLPPDDTPDLFNPEKCHLTSSHSKNYQPRQLPLPPHLKIGIVQNGNCPEWGIVW